LRILLLGADGQVGRALQRSLAPLGELVSLSRSGPQPYRIDLANPEKAAEVISRLAPQLIVNAAAYTAVDRAEVEESLARRVNADAVSALAAVAERLGAWFIHYSTDYVFDGSGTRPWTEDDAPAPLNAYGRSKLEGELALASRCDRHLVLRTSWVFAPWGQNFLRTILRLARERERLEVVDDQFGAPTSADLIADVTAHLVRDITLRSGGVTPGTYHLAARGETNWHGYARYLVAGARARRLPILVDENAILSVPSESFPLAAKRPANSRLSVDRLEDASGLSFPDWTKGVDSALDLVKALAQ
jgi:dTDP-4-dehydrorhamnose reductase